jgi:hypothetical protein
VIHAKPLKTKHLRSQRTPTDSTDTGPLLDHDSTSIEPAINHIDTSELELKYNKEKWFKPGEVRRIIILAIKALPGSSASELNYFLLEFCAKNRIRNSFSDGGSSLSGHLKFLVDKGLITRIHVTDKDTKSGAFRYYEILG